MEKREHNITTQAHWEISKLLEMGVSERLLIRLSRREIRDLLVALQLLREKAAEIEKRDNKSQSRKSLRKISIKVT